MSKILPAFINKIIKAYIYGDQPLHVRILNMLYLYGGFVAFVSLFVRIIEGSSSIPIVVTAVLVLLVIVLFFLNNRFKVFEIVSTVMCVFLGDVFLPIIFFANGGLQSGVSAYFIFVAAVIFFTQRGKRRVIILLTYFSVITSCFFAAYIYPHIIMPLNKLQYFIDNIQSFFLAGILIGGVLNFQRGLFEKEQAKNLQAQKNRIRANELLNAINDSAVFLLTSTEKNFTGTMTKSIAILARCMEFDRVYIWKRRGDAAATRYSVLYEWISGEQFKQGSMSLSASELPPHWEERFFKGQHVGGPLNSLNDEEKKSLAANGIKSILVVPVFIKDSFWGFVSFDDCSKEREFSTDEVHLLMSGALLLVSAIERRDLRVQKRTSDERARGMIDTAPLGVFYWDENLKLVDCNTGVVNMFGVSDKSEVLADFFKFSPEYQPDGTRSEYLGITLLRKALENGYCVSHWMHITPRGEQIPCEMTLTRATRSGTRMVVVYMRDLREHTRMLAEINKNNTLLHAVTEAASILLTADSKSFERACWKCFEMFGKDIEVNKIRIWQNYTNKTGSYYALKYEWSDTRDFEQSRVLTPEILHSKLFADWKETLITGQCVNGATDSFTPTIKNLLSERGIISALVIPLFLENELWGFANFADMRKKRTFTKKEESILRSGTLILASAMTRNNMTQNLIEAREEAIANTRAKSAFIATMSHEIRTPLNAIIGLAGIQMQNSLPMETHEDFEKIHNSGSSLLGIINDMLDLSKIESGSFELIESEYDLASLVNDTVLFNITEIESRPIVFELAIDPNIPSKLLGDELRVKQILNNILSNAFKYTQRGKVKCGIGFENRGRFLLVVSVEDTGVGIKTEDLGKLFSDYSQLDSSAHRKNAGTGLGLSITQKLIDMMYGEISVESEYKKGSVFTVRIPQTIVDGAPIGKQTADNIQSLKFHEDKKNATKLLIRANLSYARVLVVDDVQTNLDVARGLLLPYGLAVDCVLSAKDAIALVRGGARYDAIFIDQMMPVMDGIEAVRIIRALDSDYAKKVPIIALTANAATGSEEMFLDSGFNAYLSKPIDLMRLDAALNHFVRDKNLENGGGNE